MQTNNNKKSRLNLFTKLWSLEKKFKLISYVSILFLLFKTYTLKEDYNHLNLSHTALKVDFAKLATFNKSLVANMIIYNRTFEDFPLPIWGKVKRKGRFQLQYINPVYETIFGHHFNYDRYSIFGKNNFEIFPNNPELAQQYYENDIAVAITGVPLESIEYSSDTLGKIMELKVLKWRSIIDKKDTIIYGMVKEYKNLKRR